MLKGQEYTQIFQVTDKVYNGFIETFKDTNPLHTDDLFAKEKSFSGKVNGQQRIVNGAEAKPRKKLWQKKLAKKMAKKLVTW